MKRRTKKRRITQSDTLKAFRKASRDEEIVQHGKQITFRTLIKKNKKRYSRKQIKKLF